MGDPQRFKQQSPVSTDSPAVKFKRLYSDFRVSRKKERPMQPEQPAHVKTRIILEGHYM